MQACPVPWTDSLSALSDGVVALAALLAAIGAICGYKQWRSELLGKARHESAKRLCVAARKWLAAYHWVRYPATFANEYPDRPSVTPREQIHSNNDEQYARFGRLNALREAGLLVREAGWEAEMDIGGDVSELVSSVLSLSASLTASAQMYFLTLRTASAGSAAAQAIADKAFDIVFGVEDDDTGRAAANAVNALEARLSKHLGGRRQRAARRDRRVSRRASA